MKIALVLAVTLAVCYAAPRPQKPGEPYIEEQTIENDGLGSYHFGFKTSNGIIRQEDAITKNEGTNDEIIEVRGTVTWLDADNKERTLIFVANEDGFQPEVSRRRR
ncbi:endocuticle structural protein SgAbd-6 [Anabrus simplex]|uniref:endocuticle structural protein SgAbd-6 n=1 Tax=Anabrus simplex TaxID=316456 RepID=UPI0034DCCBD9